MMSAVINGWPLDQKAMRQKVSKADHFHEDWKALARKARVPYTEVPTHELVGMSRSGALDDHLAGQARRLGLRPR